MYCPYCRGVLISKAHSSAIYDNKKVKYAMTGCVMYQLYADKLHVL